MGVKIPHHLRDSLRQQFSKTEFDKAIFGQNWFSPVLKLDLSRITKTPKTIVHEEESRLSE